MKLVILATVVSACACALLPSAYLPPQHQRLAAAGYDQLQQSAPSAPHDHHSYQQENSRPRAALDRSAAILRHNADVNEQGYNYAFETENGIQAQEWGQEQDGIQAEGGYSYTGDDGQEYSVRYTAGANGFQVEGSHLPTAPPVPQEIQAALEQNARDEAAGIYDDGSYHEGKYADDEEAVVIAKTNSGYTQSNYQAQSQNYRSQHNQLNAYIPPDQSGQTHAFASSQGQSYQSQGQSLSRSHSFGAKVSSPSRQYLTPKSDGYQY